MIETRTWEQLKNDNIGATWIDNDGGFCKAYIGKKINKDIPHWKQINFNGCWSCDSFEKCQKAINELSK